MSTLTRFLTGISLLLMLMGIASAAEGISDANQFWHEFRQAVLTKNNAQLSSMTRFPFEVRGVDDSDPVKRYDRKTFHRIFKRVLVQPVLLPSEGKSVSKSMLQVIEEKTHLTRRDYLTSSFIRVQQLEFERSKGHWLLTGAYLEE